MVIKNYISKICLSFNISRKFSFIKLLINSKKYSIKYKRGIIDVENLDVGYYKFKFRNKKIDLAIRTYAGDIDIFYEVFWKKMYKLP